MKKTNFRPDNSLDDFTRLSNAARTFVVIVDDQRIRPTFSKKASTLAKPRFVAASRRQLTNDTV